MANVLFKKVGTAYPILENKCQQNRIRWKKKTGGHVAIAKRQ